MKKISIVAAVVLSAVLAGCGNGTPKANMKSDVDTLCYAIGMAQSRGLKDYLAMRMDVDTTYIDEFIKGLNDGANSGDDKKKQAYYAGLQIGQQVSTQMIGGLNYELFGEDSTHYVSKDNFMAGFVAGTLGKSAPMGVDSAEAYARKNLPVIKARIMETIHLASKPAGEEFMAEIAKKAGIQQLDSSGVYFEIITEGTGKVPADTSSVKVKYEGTLIDGTVFDGNMDQEKPVTFRCNNVIPGWTKALTNMPAGSKWKVYIPQEMAYGEREAGDKIKPYSALVFVIDLISVDE
ncbi:MAG: FKBP-type peptidyl-prolyl cis-trans isomerase [Bacteroidaceae bacterium]|nr:FKBP-type peptidyl-prolyl cis-trans isomerase [Bacteroidaceae bacterium]